MAERPGKARPLCVSRVQKSKTAPGRAALRGGLGGGGSHEVSVAHRSTRSLEGVNEKGRPQGRPFLCSATCPLRSRRERPDVGVAERRRASLLRCGPRNARIPVLLRLTPGVDRWTVRREPRVVPDGCAVGPGGGRVDVVAEELGREVVLRGPARVTRRAAVDLAEATCRDRRVG